MIKKSPSLSKRIRALVGELAFDENDGTFKPLASDSNSLDGLNVHCALMDEIHQWQNGRALYDIVADGITAREQPMIFMTSTAGTIREDIYDFKYDEAENVINGWNDPEGYHDERFLPVIYELDKREEWTDPKCWKKANPGLGTIKNIRTLTEKVERAKSNPDLVKNLVCKEFNIRETTSEAWLTFEELNNTDTFRLDIENKKLIWMHDGEERILSYPRYGIGGADLSQTTDLTNATVLFAVPEAPGYLFRLSMYFLPSEVLEKHVKEDHVPYDKWLERGLLTVCEGGKVHKDNVTEWFRKVREQMDIYVLWVGYDSWSAAYWVEDMKMMLGGESMVAVHQGKKTLSNPMGVMGSELRAKRIIYNNNPIDKWCLANTAIEQDKNGNIQPHKTTRPTKRIDGTAAMLDAFVVYSDKQNDYMNLI
jgi:phage terminase large subunit-like protein